MLNINVITHPPELFKAVSEHPNISVLRMDAFVSTPLPVSACQYLSTSTSISYLTLNNYIISAVNAEQLARSESIAHLEVKHGVGPNIAPIILRIPFLRLLNISGYGGASLPEIATNSTVRTLIIDRGNLQDMTPFLYNTRLRRLSFVNNANHNIDYTPFAALTNLRSYAPCIAVKIPSSYLHLPPSDFAASTLLFVYFLRSPPRKAQYYRHTSAS